MRRTWPRLTTPDQSPPGWTTVDCRMRSGGMSFFTMVSPRVALEELLRAPGCGPDEEVFRSRRLDDLPRIHEDHGVGGLARKAHLVRHHDHRHALGRELFHHGQHFAD